MRTRHRPSSTGRPATQPKFARCRTGEIEMTSSMLPQTPATPSATPPIPGVVFNWADLAQYKKEKRFLDGDPPDIKTFWAGRDDVHGLLRDVLRSAQHSIVLNMFGYDDD